VRSKALARTLAVLTVLAVVAIAAYLLDRRSSDDEMAGGSTVTEASVPVTMTSTVIVSSTTTSQVTTTETTTMTQATTTTATSTTTTTLVAEDGYVWVPKPVNGPDTIGPGGALTKHLAADIADAFGFDVADVEAAIDQVELPPEAGGNPEGWLAPGTYQVADDATALDVVQAMVDRRVQQLEDREIPRDDWERVLTAASVIETETYNENEKPKVARVLTNRLANGGPLQMDSIILYPVPEDRIFTTAEERAADQPYNSYKHNGLPPTPISNPDEASIDAFLNPTPGDWFFYVTIDLYTGETRYAVTYAEHGENVKLLKAWLATHSLP
jgi:cell division protein YceG involved in septum cleavage